ncbi:MAG TPA: penicillin-binding protein 1A [Caulobacteraceae bacterium]|jgi:penicillin-binding protein 1A
MAQNDAGGGWRTGGGPPPRPPAPRKRTGLHALLYWTAVLGVWGLIFIVAFFAVFASDLPDTSKLYDIHRQPSITYLDRSGALLAVRGSQYAPPVDLDELPEYVPAAFIAIEDRRFYYHPGFDPIGMSRAMVRNIRARRVVEGGSTLTQQLAKNLFLTPAQTPRRKAQELLLAVWLEAKFSKKQIIELYLNRVYFGAGAYGIEAAAQRYFNKPASKLTLGEAALLAGLLKAPSRYSPLSDTARAERRATVVLDEMVRTRHITAEQRDAAFKEPVRISAVLATQRAQYFVDWVDAQVRQMVGEPEQDLVVETTLDLPIQAAAERAIANGVRAARGSGVRQAALVALDGEGRVRAFVGGVNYADSQFNRAADARRQAGSAFKPFVYLTAMEQGRTPYQTAVDEPITIGNWTPRNYTGKYLGQITLQTAVAQSVNTVAARLATDVGTNNVAATAHRLGITSPIQTQPSMALGAVEVSPVEMARAFAPFANGGAYVSPHGINRIRTNDGRVLFDASAERQGRRAVVGQPALQYMNTMLRSVISGGTGTRARVPGYDLAGKTGTTSDYRDAWFVGYTGGFVAAVWVGRDDNKPMRRVTGGGAPASIWQGFMAAALPKLKVSPIPGGAAPPPANSGGVIDDILGRLGIGGDDAAADQQAAAPQAPAPQPQEEEQPIDELY